MQIATEDRLNKTFEGIYVQDFGERYFTGFFEFEIDVTKLETEELGLLLQTVMNLEYLGRGKNSGYGRLEIKEISLIERITKKKLEKNGGSFKVITDVKESFLEKEVQEALTAWNDYLEGE